MCSFEALLEDAEALQLDVANSAFPKPYSWSLRRRAPISRDTGNHNLTYFVTLPLSRQRRFLAPEYDELLHSAPILLS